MLKNWFRKPAFFMLLIILHLLAACIISGSQSTEPDIGKSIMKIESSAFMLEIEKPTGTIFRIIDKKSGRNLLAPILQSSALFKIESEDAWFINQAEFMTDLNITEIGTERILTAEYEFEEPNGSLFISVHIKADSAKPDVEFGIDVENKVNGLIIKGVHFPVIELKRYLDNSKTDRAFIPGGEGAVVEGTGIDNAWGVKDYPGSASMQFTAYYNNSMGIGLECHDTGGEPKKIGTRHNASYQPERVHIVCEHLTAHEPNAEIAKYPVVIFPVEGSWHAAAEHYKRWALEQWWAQPKSQELGRPEWTYKYPVVIESDLRPQYCGLRTMPLDKYKEILGAWTDLFGGDATLLPLYRGFAHYGTYVSPHYFPLYPDEARLRKVFSDVHAAGHYNMAMVAGMVWMKEREEIISGSAYWVEGFDGLVRNEDGEMVSGWTDVTPSGPEVCVLTSEGKILETSDRSWSGTRSQMCPGHPYTKQVLVNLAEKMADMGLDLFLLDQMNGGRSAPCYSKEHGHPRGNGSWMTETVREIMEAARKAGRAKNPDFALSLEDPGELWLPYLDIVGFRPAAVNGWPAPSVSSQSATRQGYIEPLSYTVPAFAYVYGHLVRPQTWDLGINTNSPEHSGYTAQSSALKLARAFVSGTSTSVAISPWMLVNQYAPTPEGWSHRKNPPDEPYGSMYPSDAIAQLPDRGYKPHLKLLRDTVMIANGPARRYLNHGAMIKPPPIERPALTFVERDWDDAAKRNVERKWRDFAIHYNAWKLADGSMALLLVNADLEKRYSIPFPVEFIDVSISKGQKIKIHRNSENGIVCENMAISDHEDRSIAIQPCEALMIELIP